MLFKDFGPISKIRKTVRHSLTRDMFASVQLYANLTRCNLFIGAPPGGDVAVSNDWKRQCGRRRGM